MSAILIAVFSQYETGQAVRTALVRDGFPTDRVELTASEELGRVELMPMHDLSDKLRAYFQTLIQEGERKDVKQWALLFETAVLEGKAVIAVHPRGDIETRRALEVLNRADPTEVRSKDLEKQALEHAATETETPIFTWMGKVLAAPGAPDTTGLPNLP